MCGGDILMSIFTKERVHGHLSLQKRTARFNIEELRGESRVDWLSTACSIAMRERNML